MSISDGLSGLLRSMPPPAAARRKIVRIDVRLLFGALRQGAVSVIDGVPADARLVGVYFSQERNCFVFLLEHPSFDPVPEAVEVPELTVSFEARSRGAFDDLPPAPAGEPIPAWMLDADYGERA